MALGTPKAIYVVGTTRPVRDDGVSGCSSGENVSQDSSVPRACSQSFYLAMAVIQFIGQCHEAQASEGPVSTTDNQPVLDSAGRSSPAA